MATVFKRGGKSNRSGWYYISYTDHDGKRKTRSSRTTDKATAERIANKLEADAALRRDGVIDASDDRYIDEARRPLTAHLADFKMALIGKGNTPQHCHETHTQAQKIISKCGAEFVCDLTASAVQLAIKSLCDEGKSLKTCNHYLRAIKSFSRWLNRDKRTRDDALAILEAYNAATDPRHVRRELSIDELSRLIATTERRTRPEHKMPGPDRAMVYRLAPGDRFSSQGTPEHDARLVRPRCRPTHCDSNGSPLEASADRLPADPPRSGGHVASLVSLSASGRTAIHSTAKEHRPDAPE